MFASGASKQRMMLAVTRLAVRVYQTMVVTVQEVQQRRSEALLMCGGLHSVWLLLPPSS